MVLCRLNEDAYLQNRINLRVILELEELHATGADFPFTVEPRERERERENERGRKQITPLLGRRG